VGMKDQGFKKIYYNSTAIDEIKKKDPDRRVPGKKVF
jgi:hypothetical protein